MALSATVLQREKRRFLSIWRDRPQARWQDVALRDATTASSRRARLYRTGLNQSHRNNVRQEWWNHLERILDRYARDSGRCTLDHFIDDVLELKSHMNAEYAEYWRDSRSGAYEPGFRIAHAQKSLALVLKHAWCNDFIDEPPGCPIDRWILQASGAQDPRWTNLNSPERFREILHELQVVATNSHMSLAEWELWVFNRR